MKKSDRKFDGPIPGENFTADTKNYAWHRPPDEADFVSIVEKAVETMAKPDRTAALLTLLEGGDTIKDYVTGMLRVGIGKGAIPIDQAVLAAGPLAKMAETIAEKAGIKFDRGWDQEPKLPTPTRVKSRSGVPPEEPKKSAPVEEPAPKPERGGLMGKSNEPRSEDDQMAMLGYGDEETDQ